MLRSLALLSVIAIGAHAAGETVTLNNGVEMPTLAFGANVWSAATCKQATSDALDAGFRFIWSSALIGQACQAAQGAAIGASSLPRASLFIAGTVNSGDCSDQASCYTETKTAAEAQFSTLNVTKLDMLMLDYPSSAGCDGITGQWKAFSELYAAGKVRAIAVSNFAGDQLTCVTKDPKGVKPTVNQLSYSVGKALDPDNAKLGIVEQAYSPLGSGGLATDPLLQGIGKGHNKSAVQVALRWIIQHNASINTQSRNPAHLKSDTNIYDFSLSDAEMAQLDAHSAAQTKSTQTLKTTEVGNEHRGADRTLLQDPANEVFLFKATSATTCEMATVYKENEADVKAFLGLQEGRCPSHGFTKPADGNGPESTKVPTKKGSITVLWEYFNMTANHESPCNYIYDKKTCNDIGCTWHKGPFEEQGGCHSSFDPSKCLEVTKNTGCKKCLGKGEPCTYASDCCPTLFHGCIKPFGKTYFTCGIDIP